MKKNMGSLDRILRILLAVIVIVLFATRVIGWTLGVILLFFSIMFLATSFVGVCPLYTLFGLSTKKKDKTEPKSS
jgi:hypothetical protein